MVTLSDLFIGDFRISQKFGQRPSVYKQWGLAGHDGVDWACPTGTKLLAPFDCIVIAVKKDKGGYGTHVKLWDRKQRACVLYGHMKEINVRLWQSLKCGQLVGISDNTGFSTGAHLHLGLCLTNALGFRLNRQNGFAGWINPLLKSNVNWVLKNPNKPIVWSLNVIWT